MAKLLQCNRVNSGQTLGVGVGPMRLGRIGIASLQKGRETVLSRIVIAACLVIPVAALAADEKKLTPQQQRMASCNKEAGEKKMAGDERKQFMSNCLRGDAEKKMTAQQQKMASCNREAGDKKLAGDERKKFMSNCLKG